MSARTPPQCQVTRYRYWSKTNSACWPAWPVCFQAAASTSSRSPSTRIRSIRPSRGSCWSPPETTDPRADQQTAQQAGLGHQGHRLQGRRNDRPRDGDGQGRGRRAHALGAGFDRAGVPRPRGRYRAARRHRRNHRRLGKDQGVHRAGAPARNQGNRALGQDRDGARRCS